MIKAKYSLINSVSFEHGGGQKKSHINKAPAPILIIQNTFKSDLKNTQNNKKVGFTNFTLTEKFDITSCMNFVGSVVTRD